jgi:RNA polymerase sigma-70 factor (ECF subfamily)
MEVDGAIELIERARAGDAAALKLLLQEHQDALVQRLSRRIPEHLRGMVDADDIVQETHIEVFQRIAAFELRSPNSFFSWLCTIAMSRLRNVVQQHRAVKRGGITRTYRLAGRPDHEDSALTLLQHLAGPERTPSRVMARAELAEIVCHAIDKLPEPQRQAVWLFYIESQTVPQVAKAIGRTERAVHGLCRRGREMLRELLMSTDKLWGGSS